MPADAGRARADQALQGNGRARRGRRGGDERRQEEGRCASGPRSDRRRATCRALRNSRLHHSAESGVAAASACTRTSSHNVARRRAECRAAAGSGGAAADVGRKDASECGISLEGIRAKRRINKPCKENPRMWGPPLADPIDLRGPVLKKHALKLRWYNRNNSAQLPLSGSALLSVRGVSVGDGPESRFRISAGCGYCKAYPPVVRAADNRSQRQ